MDEELVKTVTKAICTEKCAFRGEPACHTFDGDFPPEGCQEPGCEFEARAAIQAMMEAGWKSPGQVQQTVDREIKHLVASVLA